MWQLTFALNPTTPDCPFPMTFHSNICSRNSNNPFPPAQTITQLTRLFFFSKMNDWNRQWNFDVYGRVRRRRRRTGRTHKGVVASKVCYGYLSHGRKKKKKKKSGGIDITAMIRKRIFWWRKKKEQEEWKKGTPHYREFLSGEGERGNKEIFFKHQTIPSDHPPTRSQQ